MANVREVSRQKADEIIAYLQGQIDSGAWVPGHKLPTEKSLVTQFDAARNTIRKALGELEQAGMIERHVGRGTFVRGPQSVPPHAATWADASPAEINEIRVLLEPAIAELVVARATKRDLDRAQECLDNSLKAKTIKDFEHWDSELHATLIQASRNNMLIKIYDAIQEARQQMEWYEMKRRSLSDVRRGNYDRDHGEIVAALKKRDAQALRKALTNHLRAVSHNMLEA